MLASVRALLLQIIDYAGLFPPAKLPLEDALRNYLRYRKESPHGWMLGRFVCPTARLPELLALAKSSPDAALLQVTALGRQAGDLSEFFAHLEADLIAIENFRRGWVTDGVIDTIEVPLPQAGNVDEFVSYLGYAVTHMELTQLRGFLEIARSAHWQNDVIKIAKGLGSLYDTWDQGQLGLKLRCGGLTADTFPRDEEIAYFIARCNEAEIPWKATAGLHHPRRHGDEGLQVWHHGFLNVFGAGLLAWDNALPEADIVAILADRLGEQFCFLEDRFSWGPWSATTDQIIAGRANFATSFGCCSFEEPVEDLIAMGLIDTV